MRGVYAPGNICVTWYACCIPGPQIDEGRFVRAVIVRLSASDAYRALFRGGLPLCDAEHRYTVGVSVGARTFAGGVRRA